MTVRDDEIHQALLLVDDVGYAIMLKPQWDNLRAWLNQGGRGWPPKDWSPCVGA